MLLQPKNWAVFQHYKDRCPPWIKLHRDILNDRNFMRLPIASKALAPLLWLLASEAKDGVFDGSLDELGFRLHISPKEYEDGLKPLINNGFFIVASGVLADSYQTAIPETEREREGETEKETEKKRKQVATRLPKDFVFPKEWADFCVQQRPDLNTQNTFDSFKDYWVAAPKGTKLDWLATWRNWVRNQSAPKVNRFDVVTATTPPPPNQDAALRKIHEDDKKAVGPSLDTLARLAELRRKA
jgi:hypothetical protein